jgi:hypothetical protein
MLSHVFIHEHDIADVIATRETTCSFQAWAGG